MLCLFLHLLTWKMLNIYKDERDPDEPEPDDDDDDEGWKRLLQKRFQSCLKHWKTMLQKFLIEEVKVNDEIAKCVSVVPTGYYKKTRTKIDPLRLPDHNDWSSKLCMGSL